jgi:replicative DNA helicase
MKMPTDPLGNNNAEVPNMMEAALHYAGQGYPVFPVHSPIFKGGCSCGKANCNNIGKHPRTPHGFKDAVTDPLKIQEWWTECPDANIGIPTGRASGIVILDIDPRHGGDKSLDQLESQYGPLPETERIITGEGRHLTFLNPTNIIVKNATNLGGYAGLDVRGEGGYRLVPPSLHSSGRRYERDGSSPHHASVLPEWLLGLMLKGQKAGSKANAKIESILAGVPEGQRDDAIFKMVCSLRRANVPQEAALELALKAAKNCIPSFPEAVVTEKIIRVYTSSDYSHHVQEWELPIPFRQFNLPSFPAHIFPDWLRAFVEAEAIATQTPIDLSGMLAFPVLATGCQKKFVVQVKSGWVEPTNIFTATVLPPGSRKSADFADMVDPLEEYEEAEAVRMAPEIAAAQTRFKILESRLHDKQMAASKAKTAEEQVQFEQEAIQMAKEFTQIGVPVTPRLLADDATPERLTTLIRDQGGHMAVMSPEGDVFEMMAGRYSKNGAPNFAVYLKGHSGDTLRVDRTGRPSEYVKKPALTVGFAIQPDVIRGLSQKEGFRGRGLLARFLFSLPESMLGHRNPNAPEVPDDIRATYRRNVLALLGLSFAKDERGNPSAHCLKLDLSARAALLQFAADLELKMAPLGELGSIADWAGKLVGAVVRIAGLLHVAQHVDDFEPWIIPIKLETIEKAILVGHYLIPHARAAFSEMGADPAIDNASHILSWLTKKRETTLTKRDIFEGTKGRFKQVADLEKPLSLLMEHGYLRERTPDSRNGPGRSPSPGFEINPYIWSHSAKLANTANLEGEVIEALFESPLSAEFKQPNNEMVSNDSQNSQNSLSTIPVEMEDIDI